ncbi:unnamed protein product [Peronospora destructor]|uniref:Uncharacterized protein n=1 Tax=Peronospora destructor TaxID=86335 RepID=A0AAV0U2C2_9STRA|nr:unnamed protein product [Peronospora destructor]
MKIRTSGKTLLGLVPFFDIYGMMLIHLRILQAKTIVVLPRFMPDTFSTRWLRIRFAQLILRHLQCCS